MLKITINLRLQTNICTNIMRKDERWKFLFEKTNYFYYKSVRLLKCYLKST